MLDRSTLKTTAKTRMRDPLFKLIVYTLFLMVATSVVNVIVQYQTPDTILTSGADVRYVLEHYFDNAGAIQISVVASAVMLVYNLFVSVIELGYKRVCLMVARDEEVAFSDLFDPFGYWLKAIAVHFLVGLVIALGTLCFVIPGIILTYSYSQVDFVLIDNPDIGVIEAMRKSRIMMRGYKMEFFVFELSYFLWLMLASALPIAFLYVMPYMTVGKALFYEYVAGTQSFGHTSAFTGDGDVREDGEQDSDSN